MFRHEHSRCNTRFDCQQSTHAREDFFWLIIHETEATSVHVTLIDAALELKVILGNHVIHAAMRVDRVSPLKEAHPGSTEKGSSEV